MMVAFGKDKLVSIRLSEEEQSCILQYCQELPPRIHRRTETASDGTLRLMEGDADILYASLCYTLQNINNTSKKNQDWQLNKSKPNAGDEMSNSINNLPENESNFSTPQMKTM